MKIRPEDYGIFNSMEELADQAIQQVLSEEKGACGCPTCTEDMKCLILNRLEPAYIAVPKGNGEVKRVLLEDLEQSLFDQLMIETHRALEQVQAEPRHGDQRSPLHNALERIVVVALQEVLKYGQQELDFSELSAMMALVLNELKPRYTTTSKGSAFTRLVEIDPDYLARIYSRIYSAYDKLGIES